MITVDTKNELNTLRELRTKECFPIVNRGKLWYDCLTAEQISELNDWYFAWLNVTETKVIPTKPEWLDKKLSREEITW
ncbi:MAG: hypothetical protein IKA99_06500 [Clostridia bacterium]|nr:hypothetical protein [Clostridia bacterium]